MPDFRISTISNPEVYEKLELTLHIEKQLNSYLRLSDYTEKIGRIFLIYVVNENGRAIPRSDSGKYHSPQRKFTIYRNIDYDQFLAANRLNAFHLLVDNYLQIIELYLLKRKDFAGKRFYDDVARLFQSVLQPETV